MKKNIALVRSRAFMLARIPHLAGICAGIFCLLALMGLLSIPGGTAQAETAEWTIMLYMCGTDLESRHGLATLNLNDIASMWFPEKLMAQDGESLTLVDWPTGQVNLVVETGGTKRWHGMEPDEEGRTLGVNIATDRLQRYAFDAVYSPERHTYVQSMLLVDEQPLANMSSPETLTSFIQWAAREYPARKYALLLWDHGGGSRTGLFVDELFDNDILYLYELGQALADSQTQFELVAIDACLMCSIETARMLAPYANYMVASEELSSGHGSALPSWLLEIYRNPACDGGEVGSEFCDSTQRKYMEMGTIFEETQLTFTVIDLSLIDPVVEAFDALFDYAGKLYEQMPVRFNMFCNVLNSSERYGAGGADMIDLGSFLYNHNALTLLESDCRNALASALEDAVYYTVKGSGRSASKGLSFCFDPDMSPMEMDIYALNYKSAPYLALLDAVNPDWNAPDWVYEKARRLTPIEEMDVYRMEWETTTLNGMPALRFTSSSASLLECMFKLYRLNEDSDTICLLGENNTLLDWDDEGNSYYVIDLPTTWPSIEGEPCSVELIAWSDGMFMYNVPIRMEITRTNLRLSGTPSYNEASGEWGQTYEAIGLWEGYDEDTRMPARTITSLNQVSGRDFNLLYPCCGLDGERYNNYESSVPLTMYRSLDIETVPLPAGKYFCGFTIKDVFGHQYNAALIELTWDGKAFSLVDR